MGSLHLATRLDDLAERLRLDDFGCYTSGLGLGWSEHDFIRIGAMCMTVVMTFVGIVVVSFGFVVVAFVFMTMPFVIVGVFFCRMVVPFVVVTMAFVAMTRIA